MKHCTIVLSFAFLAGTAVQTFAASDEVDAAYQALQTAESTKDLAQIKTAAVKAYHLADGEACEAAPTDPDQKTAWENRVTYDRGIQVHAEYALYSAFVAANGATAVDLFSTLSQLNPKSKYLDLGYGYYFKLLQQTGQSSKLKAEADKASRNFPNNPDALLILCDSALARKQSDRALNLANRLVAALKSRPKPEGASEAQWQSVRNNMLGRGYWTAGVVEGQKNQFFDANRDLRAAMPYIQGNEALLGPALFYLGVSNYNLSRELLNRNQMREAIEFSERAAKIKGPYAEQAWQNTMVMKAELAKWR